MTGARDSVLDVVRDHARRDHLERIERTEPGRYSDGTWREIAADPLLHPQVATVMLARAEAAVEVRRLVAANRFCPLDLDDVARLANDDAPAVHVAALENPRTPLPVVEDAVAAGRGSLLMSPHCPPDLLASAARSGRTSDQALAARNPALPARDRNKLSRSSAEDVQRALVLNPALAQSDFHNLARTRGISFRRQPTGKARRAQRSVRRASPLQETDLLTVTWAAHPGAAPDWLASRFRTGTSGLQSTIARNPRTPAATLWTAFAGGWHAVLSNPSLPPELPERALASIAGTSRSFDVITAGRVLAANPSTPLDALHLLPLRDLLLGNDMHVYRRADLTRSMLLAHARTADQAALALGLLDGWDYVSMPDQSVGELLLVTAAAAAA